MGGSLCRFQKLAGRGFFHLPSLRYLFARCTVPEERLIPFRSRGSGTPWVNVLPLYALLFLPIWAILVMGTDGYAAWPDILFPEYGSVLTLGLNDSLDVSCCSNWRQVGLYKMCTNLPDPSSNWLDWTMYRYFRIVCPHNY